MAKYCSLCERNVEPKKKFNWIIFLLGFVTLGIVSAIYLIYYLLKPKTICPICGSKKLSKAQM